jgi:aminoglycoside-2''-adenylyltransferase
VDLSEADLSQWDAWSPDELARRLDGVEATWYVIAGWALDLFVGHQTREHADLEIGVRADEFAAVQDAFRDFDLVVVGDGRIWPLNDATLAAHRQTWVGDRETEAWRVDVFRERWDGDEWVLDRDPRIRIPTARLVARSSSGMPYMSPEVVLLLKAKNPRPKDELDFAAVHHRLTARQRAWLEDALALVHPGHHWLDELR